MAELIEQIVSDKAFEQVNKLKADLAALQKQMEALAKGGFSAPAGSQQATQALSEMEKLIKQTTQAQEKLIALQTVQGQEYTKAAQAVREYNAQLKNANRENNAAEGSLDQMQAKLKGLQERYRAMGEAARNGVGGQELLKQLQAQYTAVTNLEKAMGQYQRNVGNYSNATFQLSQVFRELPAFTYSAQTGVMALSNNLPMLADAFQQVKKETGSTMSALKVFGASIFSLGNIFTLAMSAFLIFNKEIMAFFKGADEFTVKMDDIRDSVNGATEDMGRLRLAMQQAKDGLISKEEALKVYNETLGKATQETKDFNEAEKITEQQGDAYIQMTIMKARAAKMLANAIKLATDAAEMEDDWFTTLKAQVSEGWKAFGSTGNPLLFFNRNPQDAYEAYRNQAQAEADAAEKAWIEEENKLAQFMKEHGFNSIDEKTSEEKKRKARQNEVDRVEIIKKEYEREKALIEQRHNDGLLEEANYYDELIQLSMKYTAKREGLSKKEAQTEAKFNEELSKVRYDSYNKLLDGLYELDKEYNKMLEDLEKKTVDKVIKERERRAKHNAYWAKEEIELIKENIAAMEKMWADDDEEVEKERQKALEKVAIVEDYYRSFQDIAQTYTDAINAKERSAFDIKTEKMKQFYDEEEERIKRSYTNQKERELELQKLSARKRAEEKALDIERKRILKEQAIRQKKADVMAAVTGAALMIIKQSIATPLPTGLPFILAAGVAGAAQVAKAAAAPIPEFAKGTDNAPEGYAVVGEKGHELVVEPSGKKWVTPAKDTITYLKKGSKVIPNDKLMDMVKNSAYVELANMNMPVTPDLYSKALVDKFEELSGKVETLSAVMANKDMRVNVIGNFDHYMHVKKNIK